MFSRLSAALVVAAAVALTFDAFAAITTVAVAAAAGLACLAAGLDTVRAAIDWLALHAFALAVCGWSEAAARPVDRVHARQIVHWCLLAHQRHGDGIRRCRLVVRTIVAAPIALTTPLTAFTATLAARLTVTQGTVALQAITLDASLCGRPVLAAPGRLAGVTAHGCSHGRLVGRGNVLLDRVARWALAALATPFGAISAVATAAAPASAFAGFTRLT